MPPGSKPKTDSPQAKNGALAPSTTDAASPKRRRPWSPLIAVLIALAAVGWMLSGQIDFLASQSPPAQADSQAVSPPTGMVADTQQGSETAPRDEGESAPAAVSPSPAPEDATAGLPASSAMPKSRDGLPEVRVTTSHASAKEVILTLQGRTEASRRVALRTETAGRVAEILIEKGVHLKAEDVILKLADDDRPERLAEAKALLHLRNVQTRAARKLSQRGFQSEIKLAETVADQAAARAAVKAAQLDLERATIKAPFDGILESRPVEQGDFVSVGSAVATVIDLDPVLVVGHVSERDIGRITIGQPGRADLVSGQKVEGTLRYVAAAADPDTRTFRVELEIDNEFGTVVDNMSAELNLPLKRVQAHKLSPAALTLADDGRIGVKGVDAENIVRFLPVSIISDEEDGVWIDGLPEEVVLITVGQEFVTDGQEVHPVFAGALPKAGRSTGLPPAPTPTPVDTGGATRTPEAAGDAS